MNNQKGLRLRIRAWNPEPRSDLAPPPPGRGARLREQGESHLRFINLNSAYFFSENRQSLQFIE